MITLLTITATEAADLVNNFGFPTAVCIVLGSVVIYYLREVLKKADKREEKLYQTLDEYRAELKDNQQQLSSLITTNARYLEILNDLANDVKELKNAVFRAHEKFEEGVKE